MATPQITSFAAKTCSRCGIEKSMDDFYDDRRTDGKRSKDGKKSACKACLITQTFAYGLAHPQQRAEATRRWRKRNPDRPNNTEADRLKRKAWWTLAEAVRTRKVVPPAVCESCLHVRKVHGHHEDYTKPLDVRWLCSKCHKNLHNSRKAG